MKNLLCVGGPLDGETRQLHDGMPYVRVPWMNLTLGKPHLTELVYTYIKFCDIEFLYYEPDGPTIAFRKLLACYAPRLAKLAQDEQRSLERSLPPGDLQTQG